MVLLKKYDEGGFVWYTNYESDKARQLERAPFAALTFWWAGLERSVRIEGYVKRCGEEESDEYFYSRPAESRLGAWASEQSRPCEGREMMEGRWRRLREEHLEEKEDGEMKTDIRRPQHWGGYRLIPDKIEFWKGRSARLHDRICYTRGIDIVDGDVREQHGWKWTRLQP